MAMVPVTITWGWQNLESKTEEWEHFIAEAFNSFLIGGSWHGQVAVRLTGSGEAIHGNK